MEDEKKEMTQEEAEQDFKNKFFSIMSEKIDGVYKDEDGFIVVPMRRRERKEKK